MPPTRSKSELYPVVLVEDRYGGAYSGGAWLAVAEASQLVDFANTGVQFCLCDDAGPSGGDIEASTFWGDPPPWIATEATPIAALESLIHRTGVGTEP